MKLLDFPLLTDENIAPEVVAGLRARGCDVRTAWDEQLIGRPDAHVLERATGQHRVVITHDVAFGRSAIRTGVPFLRIIYLRPGHFSAEFVLGLIDALREGTMDVQPPFIAVAERQRSASACASELRRPGSTGKCESSADSHPKPSGIPSAVR